MTVIPTSFSPCQSSFRTGNAKIGWVGVYVLCVVVSGCSASDGAGGSSGGATVQVGGLTAMGGNLSSSNAAGGVTATGGRANAASTSSIGGANSVGGQSPASGGVSAGGTLQGGGTNAVGGTAAMGGRSTDAGSTQASGGSNIGGTAAKGGATSGGGTATTGGASANATAIGGSSSSGGTRPVGGSTSVGGATATGGASGTPGPCDIYATGNTPCVAAHSTVRALYSAYNGSLYQVKRNSDSTTKDIGVVAPGGFANAAAQDTFCTGTTCTISIIYDQSPKGNHITPAPGGGAVKTADKPVTANKSKLTVGGHSVYAAYFEGGMGYRNNKTSGIATGDQPESMYMVTSGKHYNSLCCFDYGNAETTNNDDGNGTMEAIYFGNQRSYWGWGNITPNSDGSIGPWVEADLENGLFAGPVFGQYTANTAVPYNYVTAMIKGKPGGFAIKAGNANSGTLKTMYEGSRPNMSGYNPMKKQGAIILGIGGDNSNGSQGTFYEGCMTSGYASDATDAAVQANIIAAGYGT